MFTVFMFPSALSDWIATSETISWCDHKSLSETDTSESYWQRTDGTIFEHLNCLARHLMSSTSAVSDQQNLNCEYKFLLIIEKTVSSQQTSRNIPCMVQRTRFKALTRKSARPYSGAAKPTNRRFTGNCDIPAGASG
ncbi:hypothetical protein EDD18DRAFT_1147375 [Armillaria luteobubalina]|uniref:Uncharacterized protein n=1 Tax=Armillaria luteobubalina TaxID=153913 RepID=A0AA39V0Y5_9AGAR|nr:hypothetical protein EDD18DRAFT_1147375 [Armillaria luteobubalina]